MVPRLFKVLADSFQSQISVLPSLLIRPNIILTSLLIWPNKTYSALFAKTKQWDSVVSLLVLTWVLFFSPSGPVLRVYVLIKQSNTLSPISIFIANFCFASSFAITILFICCSVVWLIDLLSNSYHLSFVFQFGEHCLLFDPCLLFHCLLIWPQFSPPPPNYAPHA